MVVLIRLEDWKGLTIPLLSRDRGPSFSQRLHFNDFLHEQTI